MGALTAGQSHGFLARFGHAYHNLKSRHESLVKRGEAAVHQVVQTVEVGGAAFGVSAFQARYDGISIVGVPLDAALGAAGHVAAFMGLAGKYDGHLHNLSDGFLASWMVGLGKDVGNGWKRKALGGASMRGELDGDTGGQSLADEDLARVASRA